VEYFDLTEEIRAGWRKCLNEKLINFYSSRNIIRETNQKGQDGKDM
jgi:hypothetical protein